MNEGRFRSLIENALDIITILDDDGIIRYESPSIERVLGYESEELIGKSVFEFIHPDDAPNVMDVFNDGIKIRDCILLFEFRFQRKDGSWCNLEAMAKNLLDNPTVAGVVLSCRDITERVRTEKALRQRFERLQRTLEGMINALAAIAERRDPYAVGHQQRVTRLACAVAEEMGLPEEQIEGLRVAGTLQDIGEITVPVEILCKPTGLKDIEFDMIKVHPQVSHNLLKTIEFPWPVAQILLQHHERMDGSGYPQGLSGEEIMLEARILAVADVVDAMASPRPHRPARDIDEALEEISRNRGILYDPEVVDACLRLFTEKGFTFEQGMSVSEG